MIKVNRCMFKDFKLELNKKHAYKFDNCTFFKYIFKFDSWVLPLFLEKLLNLVQISICIKNLFTFAEVLYYNHLSRKAEGNGPLKP